MWAQGIHSSCAVLPHSPHNPIKVLASEGHSHTCHQFSGCLHSFSFLGWDGDYSWFCVQGSGLAVLVLSGAGLTLKHGPFPSTFVCEVQTARMVLRVWSQGPLTTFESLSLGWGGGGGQSAQKSIMWLKAKSGLLEASL